LTREKLKFNEDMRQYVPAEQLWTEFLGDLEFEYDHATYWPALLKLCEERHAEFKARWTKAGKNYGESEVYLRGGDAQSVGGQKPIQETSVPQGKEASDQANGIQTNGNLDVVDTSTETALTSSDKS
jgi:hypothetical protein